MKLMPYPVYKNSEIEWLGNLPVHWGLSRIKWIFEIKKRIVGELGFDVLSITQNGLKIKDTESGEGQLSMDYSKYQLVNVNDFAMNHMDLLTGYVDISIYKGVTSPDYRVFSFRDSNKACKQYFLYLFQMGYKSRLFFPFGQGSSQIGRWRLPTDEFNNFIFPIPELVEQNSIATYLDRETEKIAKLIEEQILMKDLLTEKITTMVMSSIVLPGIKQIRLENTSTLVSRAVIQTEGQLYTPIGLFNRGRGLFHKEARHMAEMGDSDFYWIEEGDLIISGQFAWEGAVALASSADNGCVVSHRYPVMRGKPGVALTEYLLALFSTRFGDFLLNENSRGAAGRNRPLNIKSLLKEKIPVVDIKVQKKIAELVHSRSKLFTEITKQIDLLKEHRTALILAAVTGKIDVREAA